MPTTPMPTITITLAAALALFTHLLQVTGRMPTRTTTQISATTMSSAAVWLMLGQNTTESVPAKRTNTDGAQNGCPIQ